MNALCIAIQFLTRIPVYKARYNAAEVKSSLYWYSSVGLIIGALLTLFWYALTWINPFLDSQISAALITVMWIMITGALHLDGLADSTDAWMGGQNKHQCLLIMKDPQCGPGGVTAIVLVVLLKFISIDHLLQHEPLFLLVVPALARASLPILFLLTRYARRSGLGQPFSEGIKDSLAIAQAVPIIALTLLISGWQSVWVMALLGLVFWWLRKLMIQRIGGVTGDTAGAMIEVLEVSALLSFTILY